MRQTTWLGILLVGAGCGTGEGTAYILLDETARAARIEVEVDGRVHAGALPLEVEPASRVELLAPAGRRRLDVVSGHLYEARGGGGEVRDNLLGTEVRADLVGLAGPEGVVRDLASALGARAPERWNGRWRVEGPDALVRLAWMGDQAGVTAVIPVVTEAGQARAATELAQLMEGLPVPAPAVRRRDPAPIAALVGFYTGDPGPHVEPHSLHLDAEGNFTWERCGRGRCGDRRCSRVTGQYHVRHGQLELDGTDLAFKLRIGGDGRLEGPGVGFSIGGQE